MSPSVLALSKDPDPGLFVGEATVATGGDEHDELDDDHTADTALGVVCDLGVFRVSATHGAVTSRGIIDRHLASTA